MWHKPQATVAWLLASGKPVAEVQITGHNLDKGTDRATVTNPDGIFTFTNLEPGPYEFAAIKNKIDPSWPLADRLAKLIHPQTSLDKIFDAVVVPVLLTYDSECINNHNKVTATFQKAFEAEVLQHRETFAGKSLPNTVRLELFLFPLESKAQLVKSFDERIKQWQAL